MVVVFLWATECWGDWEYSGNKTRRRWPGRDKADDDAGMQTANGTGPNRREAALLWRLWASTSFCAFRADRSRFLLRAEKGCRQPGGLCLYQQLRSGSLRARRETD